MKSFHFEALLTCFKLHILTSKDNSSDIKQLALDTFIYIHISIASARPGEKRIEKFRLRLNKAAAVTSYQILIRHNLVLGGRGKPLFFYFHL